MTIPAYTTAIPCLYCRILKIDFKFVSLPHCAQNSFNVFNLIFTAHGF